MLLIDINNNTIMEFIIIIALIFLFSYFIESVFGFGGTIIALTMLSFLIDAKNMVYLGIYAAIIANIVIILTDRKSFSKKVFISMFPISIIGTVIGVFLFVHLSNILLLKLFALFLLIFAIKSLIFDNLKLNKNPAQKIILFFGGFIQGIFGTGGPLSVIGIRDSFSNKSELRTTIAVLFLVFNTVRVLQLYAQNSFPILYVASFWWIVLVVPLAIIMGYAVHIKINEKYFRLGVSLFILIASIILLVR